MTMALAGLRKQINKANQFVSEKMGAAEGTKLTEEYGEMEKKTDGMVECVTEMLEKTKDFLQPNPATRTKLMLSSKVVQSKAHAYPQPEGTLGETMIRSSRRIGDESSFSQSLNEMGEALKQMAEVKFALEDNVKQNFLEPLTHLQNKDVRDVMHHRKKLEGRRLDFDCKKRRMNIGGGASDLKSAEEKFEESLNLASMGMFNLLQNETEQISQLAAFSEALYEYHQQCATILENLTKRLMEQKQEAANKPQAEFVPTKLSDYKYSPSDEPATGSPGQFNGASSSSSLTSVNNSKQNNNSASTTAHLMNARTPVQRGPCAQALYDFDAENPGELGFKEGDIIVLTQKIDDNWYQGTVNSKTGMFPVAYVQVLVPIA